VSPLRVLLLGDPEREAAHALALFAAQPENHYRPGPAAKPPGDDPRHCLQLNDYRCVFSFTHFDAKLYRHLSISVPVRGSFPHEAAVEEIGHLFGFKGKLDTWHVNPNQAENCVVVAQDVGGS
jgi:hypothetical protein